MKSKLLLPAYFKNVGLLLLVPSLIFGALVMYDHFELAFLQVSVAGGSDFAATNNNLTDEAALTSVIISLLMIAFAREKEEDEFIHFTRLESWQWAIVLNFILLLAAIWFVFDTLFLEVMVYNMLTIPVLFIIRFHYLMFRNKRAQLKNLPA